MLNSWRPSLETAGKSGYAAAELQVEPAFFLVCFVFCFTVTAASLSDHTEIPPPPDKVAPPPKLLIQEEICSEICESEERFTQSLGGLSEVPPPSAFYTNGCSCQVLPEHTGETQNKTKNGLSLSFILWFECQSDRCEKRSCGDCSCAPQSDRFEHHLVVTSHCAAV